MKPIVVEKKISLWILKKEFYIFMLDRLDNCSEPPFTPASIAT